MKITSVKTALFNRNNANNKTLNIKNDPPKDCFVKSKAPSFRGAEDPSSPKDGFNVLDIFMDVMTKMRREQKLRGFIEFFSDKKQESFLKQSRNLKMEELIRRGLSNDPSDCEFFIEKFNNAGIKTVFNFQNYLSTYNKSSRTKQAFKSHNIEALDIYAKLESKGDLARYGELLLYLNRENAYRNSGEEEINFNEVTGFLKKIKANSDSEFEEKFSHIASSFNNFNNVSDEYQAISYLMQTYPEKTEFINQALEKNPPKGKVKAEDIYSNNPDIIDYLYENNDGKSLDPLPSIINQLSSNKSSSSELKKILDEDCEISSTEDVVSFLELMAESQVTLDDLKKMSKNSAIEDSSIITAIDRKESIVKRISSLKGLSEKDSYEIYKKFNDFLNVLCSPQNYDESKLTTFFNIVENFNRKNSKDMLELYKDVYGISQKEITSEQFEEFIDIMEYCPSPSFIKEAKAKKIKPIDALKEEKKKFLSVKDDIESFIADDKEGYFLGLSTREVYLKYKDLFDKADSAQSVLDNIIKLNIKTSSDYKNKVDRLKDIEKYCPDRKTLFKLINNAGIKLDSTKGDDKHINNCIKVLNCLKEVSSEDEYNKRLEYVIKSKFLSKSKDYLDEFFDKHQDDKELTRIMTLMADKKVLSVDSFEKFIKKYKGKDGGYDNLLKHLENSGDDVDFSEYSRILKMLGKMFKDKNIPVKLNNDNILSVNIADFKGLNRITHKTFVQTINSIKNAEGGNFLCTLRNSFTDKEGRASISFEIANEIISKVYTQDDYFDNIMSKLNINADELTQDKYSELMHVEKVSKELPKEFVDFVNSNDWLDFNNDPKKVPNLSLHARLRFIDRFLLNDDNSIEDLYKASTKNKAKKILKAIYTEDDMNILDNNEDDRIVTMIHHNGDAIKSVFTKDGKMVTIIAKGR